MSDKLIGTIKRNSLEEIHFQLRNYQGRDFVDMRTYFADNGTMKPTKKGITFNIDKWEEFKKLMSELQTEINYLTKPIPDGKK